MEFLIFPFFPQVTEEIPAAEGEVENGAQIKVLTHAIDF